MAVNIKRIILTALFLSAVFSIYARPDIALHIPEVSGAGIDDETNAYITHLLIQEARAKQFQIRNNAESSDYSINVLLGGPFYDRGAFGEVSYIFHLELTDNQPGGFFIEHNLEFDTVETIENFIPSLMANILAYVNDLTDFDPGSLFAGGRISDFSADWRNEQLYIGVRIFQTYHSYLYKNGNPIPYMDISLGISAELLLFDYLSTEAAFEIAPSRVNFSTTRKYSDMAFYLPLTVKYIFRTPGYTVAGALAGFQLNLSLLGVSSFSIGWTTGIYGGVKAGPGEFFIEPRFSMDIGSPRYIEENFNYKSYMIRFTMGYKLGFSPRI